MWNLDNFILPFLPYLRASTSNLVLSLIVLHNGGGGSQRKPKDPDYRHKFTNECLWVDDCSTPSWVKLKLSAVIQGDTTASDPSDFHHHHGARGLQPTRKDLNNLFKMYINKGCMSAAQLVFNRLLKKDVVSWTTLIAGYGKHGHVEEAFASIQQMQQEGVQPDKVTYMSILKACANPRSLEWGKQVHAQIIEAGFESDLRVGTALINMYAKCRCIKEAFEVFENMQHEGVELDEITYISILNACANPADLKWGRHIHDCIRTSGFDTDVRLGNALIGMYIKCGSKEEAFEVFHDMQQKGMTSNRITYMSILNACSSPSALDWGMQVDAQIKKFGFDSDICVCNALIGMYVKCESNEGAMKVFQHMLQKAVQPDKITYMSILNACASPAALDFGKQVHFHIRSSQFETDLAVGTALINMYAKCGGNEEAFDVYHRMQEEGVDLNMVTYICILKACTRPVALDWGKQVHSHIMKSGLQYCLRVATALINMYTKCGVSEEAFTVYHQMLQEGVEPDNITYLSILNAIGSPAALDFGKQVHACIRKSGLQFDVDLGTALISMYARCGGTLEAFGVYDQMQGEGAGLTINTYICILKACMSPAVLNQGREVHAHIKKTGFDKDLHVGTALISMYAQCGSSQEAFEVFHHMQQAGVEPDNVAYVSMLNACASPDALDYGKQIHEHIISSGFNSNFRVWTALISMYAQCGSHHEAFEVFRTMQEKGVEADKFTYMSILSACANSNLSPTALDCGRQVHAHIRKSGFNPDTRLENALLDMYIKCGSNEEAFQVFNCMQQMGRKPDNMTYISILNACANQMALDWGKQVHAQIKESVFRSDVLVGTALISMYAKCGASQEAFEIFHHMQQEGVWPNRITCMNLLNACASPRDFESGKQVYAHLRDSGCELDVGLWNSLIRMYAKYTGSDDAFELYHKMHQEGVQPESSTYVSILNTCVSPRSLAYGKEIHAHVKVSGLEADERVGNALICMYVKCGGNEGAVELYHHMQQAGLQLNRSTYMYILKACTNLTALAEGKQLHRSIVEAGLGADTCIGNALIDMYAKCGSLSDARKVFDAMRERDLVSWTVTIVGLAQHGCQEDALDLFKQMKQEGVVPDAVTFVGVLSACSHGGLVDEGLEYFNSMCEDHGITPVDAHYGCIVDLFGRGGHLHQAEDFIRKIPIEATSGIWATLLGACRIYDNVELAECAANHCLKLDPENAAVYVTLSHIYAGAGMWDSVAHVENTMKERGIKNDTGCCWVEVEKKVHTFVAEDRTHSQTPEIYAALTD